MTGRDGRDTGRLTLPLGDGRPVGFQTVALNHDLEADVVHDRTGLLTASAVFDVKHRAYRYLLTRTWDTRPPLVFVMLNPATADAVQLDPTVSRCVARARRLGYGGCTVLNLYALRGGDPTILRRHPDPVGPHNDAYLAEYATRLRQGSRVVVAWGGYGPDPDRAKRVLTMLWDAKVETWCLGVCTTGEPKHPLYRRNDQPLLGYPCEPETATRA